MYDHQPKDGSEHAELGGGASHQEMTMCVV